MWIVIKSWDNRKTANRKICIKGRTWIRRIIWLENEQYQVKLKLENGEEYKEVLPAGGTAQIIWNRFKEGQSINDAISILAVPVKLSIASKKANDQDKRHPQGDPQFERQFKS